MGVNREVGRQVRSLSCLSFHSQLTLRRKPLCEHFQTQQALAWVPGRARDMALLGVHSPPGEDGVQVRLNLRTSGCHENLGVEVITQAH